MIRVPFNGQSALLSRIDHLVFGAPELSEGIDVIEQRLGVRATPGGRHPGLGTRNALVGLGPKTYLEILAPDHDQPMPDRPRWFGVDDLTAPRLVGWAATCPDLERLAASVRNIGIELGTILSGSRHQADGILLVWRATDARIRIGGGVVPFFIDWGQTPHPARFAAAGATLVGLRAEHPDGAWAQTLMTQLGLDLPVKSGPAPALIATISGPRGTIELK